VSQDSISVIDQGLRSLLASVEHSFVKETGMRSCRVPAQISEMKGVLDGSPLFLRTRRYRGIFFDSLTVAVLESAERLRSLTVIGLPPPGAPWPILGMDIIALRGSGISLVALDLAPTDLPLWETSCAPIMSDLHAQLKDAVVPRKRPEFTADAFSRLALIAGVRASREGAVFSAVETLLLRTIELLQRMPTIKYTNAAQERRERWLEAEKQNRKEHDALARLFGPAVAKNYLDGFLFASRTGAE